MFPQLWYVTKDVESNISKGNSEKIQSNVITSHIFRLQDLEIGSYKICFCESGQCKDKSTDTCKKKVAKSKNLIVQSIV